MLTEFKVGSLYSNDEIFKSLGVSNAGGIRVSVENNSVVRATIMTSVRELHHSGENPYHDRLEGSVLTYTAAGKVGEQTLAGMNSRIIGQKKCQISHLWLCFNRKPTRQKGWAEALGILGVA